MKELISDPEFLKTLIPTTISLLVTGFATLIIGMYLERFRNRILFLKRKISFQSIAYASKDDFWGHIRVLYNEVEAKNLTSFNLEIINDTSRDIEDFILEVSVDPESWIYVANTFDNDSNKPLVLTADYNDFYNNVYQRDSERRKLIQDGESLAEDPQLANDIDTILGMKKYHVEVLNRNSKITCNLLVENKEGKQTTLFANISKKGIKLIDYQDESIQNQKNLWATILIGLSFAFLASSMLISNYPESKFPIIIAVFIGLLNSAIGIGVLYMYKFFKKLVLS